VRSGSIVWPTTTEYAPWCCASIPRAGVCSPRPQEIYDAVVRVREKKPRPSPRSAILAASGRLLHRQAPANRSSPIRGRSPDRSGVIMADRRNLLGAAEKKARVWFQGIVVKAGKFKDIGSPLRDMTEEERRLARGLARQRCMDNSSAPSPRAVSSRSRRFVPLSDGRIYSGEQAPEAPSGRFSSEGLRDAVYLAAQGTPGSSANPQLDRESEAATAPPGWWPYARGPVLGDAGPAPRRGFGGLQFLYSGPHPAAG